MFYKMCLGVLIIGGINWGLVGLFNFDLVAWLFGGTTVLISRAVYALIALAAIGCIPALFSSPDEIGDSNELGKGE